MLASYYVERVGAETVDDVSIEWADDAIRVKHNRTGMQTLWMVVAPETIDAIKREAIRYMREWPAQSTSKH